MKRTKRILALLLAAVMMLGVLPMTVAAETQLYSASAYVDKPKPNHSLSTWVSAGSSEYTVTFLGWYIGVPEVGHDFLGKSHQVEENERYVATVEFTPKSGYAFAFADDPENANVKIGGSRAYYCGKGSTDGSLKFRATVKSYRLRDFEYIEYIEEPIIGKTASYNFEIYYESCYEGATMYWFETDTPVIERPEEGAVGNSVSKQNFTFKADKYYTVLFHLSPKSDCIIENSWFKINNHEAEVYEDVNYAQVWYCFGKPTEKKQVYDLDVDIDYPIVGEKITDSANVIDCGSDYTCKVLGWYEGDSDYTEGTFITDSSVFEDGKNYVVTVEFTLKDGTSYAYESDLDDYYADINGRGATYCGKGTSPNSFRFRTWWKAHRKLDNVAITGLTPPVIGKNLSFYHESPETVDFSSIYWVELDSEPTCYEDIDNAPWINNYCDWSADYTFKADKYYAVALCTEADWGYVFTAADVTLNGDYATFYEEEPSIYHHNKYGYYYLGKPSTTEALGSVEVWDVAVPLVGQNTSFTCKVTESESIKGDDLMWVEMDKAPTSREDVDKVISGGGGHEPLTFKADKNYVAVAVLYIDRKNIVTSPWATVNNSSATYVKYADGALYVYYHFGKPQYPITSVAVTGVNPPVIGKKADYSMNITDSDKIWDTLGWISMNHAPTSIDDIWDNGTTYYEDSYFNDLTFEEGRYYVAVAVPRLRDGYAFSNLSATVNGKEPTFIDYDSGYGYAYIFYNFGKLISAPQIESVEITNLTPPALGEKASYTCNITNGDKMHQQDIYWVEMDKAPASTNEIDDIAIKTAGKSVTFKEDKYYVARIDLHGKNGYALINSKITVNGNRPTDVKFFSDSEASVYVYFGTVNPKFTVSGYVITFGGATDTLIQLIPEGTSEVAYEKAVVGNKTGNAYTDTWSFAEVPVGNYILRVSKKGHATAEYPISVVDADVTQDVVICPKGDVNGDGNLTAVDVILTLRHIAGWNITIDQNSADYNGDGKIVTSDVILMLRRIAGWNV